MSGENIDLCLVWCVMLLIIFSCAFGIDRVAKSNTPPKGTRWVALPDGWIIANKRISADGDYLKTEDGKDVWFLTLEEVKK